MRKSRILNLRPYTAGKILVGHGIPCFLHKINQCLGIFNQNSELILSVWIFCSNTLFLVISTGLFDENYENYHIHHNYFDLFLLSVKYITPY